MAAVNKYTEDTLFNGRVICRQHRKGYRFSLDAVLLGNFIRPASGSKVLDLGCGCGVIPLILAYRWPNISIAGLEIQPDLAALARENVTLNSWQERIKIIPGDLKSIKDHVKPGSFDWVVSNPPYRKSGSGKLNLDAEQAIARHEQSADIVNVIRSAAYAVKKRGRVALVYPASRGTTLISEMKKSGLEPKRILIVYSYPGSPARLLLIEAVKEGGEELVVLPPFYIYEEKNGRYSPEMAEYYSS